MAGALMDARAADSLLDQYESLFLAFAQSHAMQLKRNDHFEGINRVLQWNDDGIVKSISVEYSYSDEPRFEVHLSAFQRIPLFLSRFGGPLGKLFPLEKWFEKLDDLLLPIENDDLVVLLEQARMQLMNVTKANLKLTVRQKMKM